MSEAWLALLRKTWSAVQPSGFRTLLQTLRLNNLALMLSPKRAECNGRRSTLQSQPQQTLRAQSFRQWLPSLEVEGLRPRRLAQGSLGLPLEQVCAQRLGEPLALLAGPWEEPLLSIRLLAL